MSYVERDSAINTNERERRKRCTENSTCRDRLPVGAGISAVVFNTKYTKLTELLLRTF